MSTPRLNVEQKTILRDQLLTEDWQGNSSLKLKLQLVDSAVDKLRGKNTTPSGPTDAEKKAAKDSAVAADLLAAPFEKCLKIGFTVKGKRKEEGSIIQLIRADIEQCIENGTIINKEQGDKRLEQYKLLLTTKLATFLETDFISVTVAEEVQNLAEAVIAKRDQMISEAPAAIKREIEHPKTQETKNNAKTDNITTPTAPTTLINSKTQIQNMYIFIEQNLVEEYGKKMSDLICDAFEKDILTIIKQDIKEFREKGYIQTDHQEYQHIRQYMYAIENNLIETINNNKQSPDSAPDTAKVLSDLKTVALNTKDALIKKVEGDTIAAQLKEKENMERHKKSGKIYMEALIKKEQEAKEAKEVKKAILENAKDVYKSTYKEIIGQRKIFSNTRCLFNSALRQQENGMLALGATKKEIQELKKDLQATELKSLSARSTASKTTTPRQSTDATEKTTTKSRWSRGR